MIYCVCKKRNLLPEIKGGRFLKKLIEKVTRQDICFECLKYLPAIEILVSIVYAQMFERAIHALVSLRRSVSAFAAR